MIWIKEGAATASSNPQHALAEGRIQPRDEGPDMNDLELINASLENAAERCDDLTPLFFDAFFTLRPEAPSLFSANVVAKGRMMIEILNLVVEQAEGAGYVEHTVKTSASDHSFWGVTLEMYNDVFRALLSTLRTLIGDAWTAETEAAWQRQIAVILDHTRVGFRTQHTTPA